MVAADRAATNLFPAAPPHATPRPKGVNLVILSVRRSLPIYFDKLTFSESVGTSRLCHKPSLGFRIVLLACAACPRRSEPIEGGRQPEVTVLQLLLGQFPTRITRDNILKNRKSSGGNREFKRTDVLLPRMLRIIEDLAGDRRRLDERIEGLSSEIETLARQDKALRARLSLFGSETGHAKE
jgi:hypothetical protein